MEYAAAVRCPHQNLLRLLIQKLAAVAPKRSSEADADDDDALFESNFN